jgi:Ser/Thr protein kinase RdoA (MazF antagonist)
MVQHRAYFSSTELTRVLAYYAIGIISQIRPLVAGNAHAPKVVVTSDQGTYLLKRRPHGKDDPARVAFAHSVQALLEQRNFPVAHLIPTREGATMLCIDGHLYELFNFVIGTRYDGAAEATIDAGRQLARFHAVACDMIPPWMPMPMIFHDSNGVRRNFAAIVADSHFKQTAELNHLAAALNTMYDSSSRHVNKCGFAMWRKQMTHGDWHQGNMLFAQNKVVAVLDFDSMKSAPIVMDIANGILHFSMATGKPNPIDWPDYLDQAKLVQFLNGYRQAGIITDDELAALPDLMIESLIAEAVMPIAATGKFANLNGLDFLKMIDRKCRWVDKNRTTLGEAIFAY